MKSRLVVCAIIEKDGQILLGKKPVGVGPYPDTWHIPGGGVYLGEESLEEAVRREIREEVGIEVGDIKRVTFTEDKEKDKHGELTHYIFLIFHAVYTFGEVNANDDMEELIWVQKKDLKKYSLTRPSTKLFQELGWI